MTLFKYRPSLVEVEVILVDISTHSDIIISSIDDDIFVAIYR